MDWFLYDKGPRHERVNVAFPFLLKIFENQRFSGAFKGVQQETLRRNG